MIDVAIRHDFGPARLAVDFTAPSGITALFGRSGAGKSSVALAIAGLFRPDAARITLNGRVLQDEATFLAPHQRRLGVMFQEARMFPHLTVAQNLTYAARHGRARPGVTLGEVADLLGIAPLLPRATHALSGGERARVALGRAVLSDPAALILDEPFAALDAPRRAEILPWLQRLHARFALPMVYISHQLAEVAQLATTLVVLEAGRVVAQGPVAEILSDPALVPVFGAGEAGSILPATVAGPAGQGLTQLDTPGGAVFLPGSLPPPGTGLRLRVKAQDVMLALGPVPGISALNLLSATVDSLTPDGEAGMIVTLRLGPVPLLARITRRSAEALALRPGLPVQAILKTVALAG